jgi:hypothetical protein
MPFGGAAAESREEYRDEQAEAARTAGGRAAENVKS